VYVRCGEGYENWITVDQVHEVDYIEMKGSDMPSYSVSTPRYATQIDAQSTNVRHWSGLELNDACDTSEDCERTSST
jgi:hypothetical protein